jgi:sirohydrochlorin ferrochelatase
LVDEAPRGADTTEVEADIIGTEEALSALVDASKALTDDFVETRNPTLRARLRELAKEIEEEEQALKGLKEKRDRLSAPYLLRRIEALGVALQAQPFDVHQANLALRAVVSSIVLDVERSRVTFRWRDTDHASYLTVNTGKHSRLFDGASSKRDA